MTDNERATSGRMSLLLLALSSFSQVVFFMLATYSYLWHLQTDQGVILQIMWLHTCRIKTTICFILSSNTFHGHFSQPYKGFTPPPTADESKTQYTIFNRCLCKSSRKTKINNQKDMISAESYFLNKQTEQK